MFVVYRVKGIGLFQFYLGFKFGGFQLGFIVQRIFKEFWSRESFFQYFIKLKSYNIKDC